MAGLNQNFKKVFVTNNNTLLAAGTTTDLADGQMGIFDAETYAATAAPTWGTSKGIMIVEGTPDLSDLPAGAGIRNETDKSKVILGKKITGWRKKAYSAGQNQIMTIGWDGNADNKDTKNMSVKCDEIKHLYIRLTGKPIEDLFPRGYLLHVQAQGPCCTTCGDSCADIDPTDLRDQFYDAIVGHTFLGGIALTKYITVTKLDTTSTAGDPVVGLQFESAFVERADSTFYFDLFPYNNEPVIIEVSEWNPDWHGDPSRCISTYPVTETQALEYPFGEGGYVMRYEAKARNWDFREYSKDIAIRQAEGQTLNTIPTNNYDKYTLTFEYSYKVLGWSDTYVDVYDVEVFVATGQTAFATAINAYITSVTGLGLETV